MGRYARACTALAARRDFEFPPDRASFAMDVDGVPVFVKRVALTDVEQMWGYTTANLFDLPAFCQYGVGSPGFGAWRELAANIMATNWVLARQTDAFPLLYHWRVVPGAPPVVPEHRDLDAATAYWGGSDQVRSRLSAVAEAKSSLVLFQEHIPFTLVDWLPTLSGTALVSAYAMVERCLREGITFMNGQGLHHFDAHFGNLLTDGERLYIGDLGLATSHRFNLSDQERAFLGHHRTHDAAYAAMGLVNWIATHVCGYRTPEYRGTPARNEFVRRCAAGHTPPGLAEPFAAILRTYSPVAVVMNAFYWELFGTRRDEPYPADEIRALLPISALLPSLPSH
jgi:hypothetical protein